MSERLRAPIRRLNRCAVGVAAAAFALAAMALAGPAPEAAADPAPEALLRAADAPRRVIDEGAIRIRATVAGPGAAPVVSDLEVLVRGVDQVLCIFRAGPFAGRRILSLRDKVWLIFPGTSRPVPVSASQRLVGGASIADVARLRFAADFDATLRPEREDSDGVPCLVLDLKARDRKVPYASGVLWSGAADRLPRRALFRLRSGLDAKEVRFERYERTARGLELRREEIVHLLPNERGLTTTLDYLGAEARPIDPALFTPDHAHDPV
ncbi:MAG TPA: outer membrane lipoprotein-sorting protein [Candidatus Polarisedimenticolia bacterium]|nr:outer membrane lipoprotein-sorting protein [Candidatus Polarisedimenticolia bacterium]